MSAGIRALRRINIGKESTPGTATTASAKLIGTLGMKLDQKFYRPSDLETGRLSSYERSNVVGEQATLPFESDANYEQLGYIFGMGICGSVAASTTGIVVTRTYCPALTSSNSVDTYLFEYGDDVQAFKSPFVFATNLEISGTLDDAVKVKANLVGQYVATTTFTATTSAIAPTTLSPVITGTGKIYTGTTWATMITISTQASATLVDFSWKVVGATGDGITPVKYADGNIYFTDRAEKKRHVELNMTMAFNSTAVDFWSAYIASPQTVKFVEIAFQGAAISSGYNALKLDGAYVIDTYDTLTEREGQDIVKVKLLSQYDATSGKDWQAVLVNSISALP